MGSFSGDQERTRGEGDGTSKNECKGAVNGQALRLDISVAWRCGRSY